MLLVTRGQLWDTPVLTGVGGEVLKYLESYAHEVDKTFLILHYTQEERSAKTVGGRTILHNNLFLIYTPNIL